MVNDRDNSLYDLRSFIYAEYMSENRAPSSETYGHLLYMFNTPPNVYAPLLIAEDMMRRNNRGANSQEVARHLNAHAIETIVLMRKIDDGETVNLDDEPEGVAFLMRLFGYNG